MIYEQKVCKEVDLSGHYRAKASLSCSPLSASKTKFPYDRSALSVSDGAVEKILPDSRWLECEQ